MLIVTYRQSELQKFVYLTFVLLLFSARAMTQSSDRAEGDLFPPVGLIGEDEALLGELAMAYPDMLLSVFGNDMDLAYEKWMATLGAIEDYAEEIGYDIKGLKTYLLIYWGSDGSIQHLAFYPKSNSRNIPIAELKAFFKGFVGEHKMQVDTDNGFSHYASAAFPLHERTDYTVKKN